MKGEERESSGAERGTYLRSLSGSGVRSSGSRLGKIKKSVFESDNHGDENENKEIHDGK